MCADCWSVLLTLSLGVPDESTFLKQLPHLTNMPAWLAGKKTLAAGEIKYTSSFQLYTCNVLLLAPLFFECTCAVFLFSINLKRQSPNWYKTHWLHNANFYSGNVLLLSKCVTSKWGNRVNPTRLTLPWLWTLQTCWAEIEMALTHMVLGYDCEAEINVHRKLGWYTWVLLLSFPDQRNNRIGCQWIN